MDHDAQQDYHNVAFLFVTRVVRVIRVFITCLHVLVHVPQIPHTSPLPAWLSALTVTSAQVLRHSQTCCTLGLEQITASHVTNMRGAQDGYLN